MGGSFPYKVEQPVKFNQHYVLYACKEGSKANTNDIAGSEQTNSLLEHMYNNRNLKFPDIVHSW